MLLAHTTWNRWGKGEIEKLVINQKKNDGINFKEYLSYIYS